MTAQLIGQLAHQFNAASEIATVANTVKAVDITPIVSGITGLLPMTLGAIVVGIGIRKMIGWTKRGLRSI